MLDWLFFTLFEFEPNKTEKQIVKGDFTFSDGTRLSNDNSNFILLAEDDIDDQEFFIDAFSGITDDIKVFAVNNGSKAIHVLNSLPIDKAPQLIILDYNLPELSGADILKMLHSKKQFNDVPKVVWSTSTSPLYEQICMDLGAKAYLVKPSTVSGIEQLAKELFSLCVK